MNNRDKAFLIILVSSILGVFVLVFMGLHFFWKPMKDLDARIREMDEKNDALKLTIETFMSDKQKMEIASRKSLPSNADAAAALYMSYLRSVLKQGGMEVDEVKHDPVVEMKTAVTIPGIKKVNHRIITFQARAKGELKQLIKALDLMQKTPYEHRIRTLTVDRVDASTAKNAGSKLTINMVVETLLVANTSNRGGLPPGIDPKYPLLDSITVLSGGTAPLGWGLYGSSLWINQSMPNPPSYRLYDDLAYKNIFVGALPPIPLPPPPLSQAEKDKKKWSEGPQPPPEFVPMYIRLVMIDQAQQDAYLLNLVYNLPQMRVSAKKGYNTIKVTDEEREYEYFEAKILRVDPQDVYFQMKDKIYGIHIGQSFADAMYIPKAKKPGDFFEKMKIERITKGLSAGKLDSEQVYSLEFYNHLSTEQIKSLDLAKLYDEAWAKSKTVTTAAQKKKGGR